jgi:hypothetical protein
MVHWEDVDVQVDWEDISGPALINWEFHTVFRTTRSVERRFLEDVEFASDEGLVDWCASAGLKLGEEGWRDEEWTRTVSKLCYLFVERCGSFGTRGANCR